MSSDDFGCKAPIAVMGDASASALPCAGQWLRESRNPGCRADAHLQAKSLVNLNWRFRGHLRLWHHQRHHKTKDDHSEGNQMGMLRTLCHCRPHGFPTRHTRGRGRGHDRERDGDARRTRKLLDRVHDGAATGQQVLVDGTERRRVCGCPQEGLPNDDENVGGEQQPDGGARRVS